MVIAVRFPVLVVRVDEKDRAPRAACQRARLRIDGVAELLDRAPDLLACLGTDVRLVVEHPGDGDPCNPGRLRDVVDG